MTFLKNNPTPCATLKQIFLDCFELVVAHFGPSNLGFTQGYCARVQLPCYIEDCQLGSVF